jgi:hypothetical protein
MLSIYFWVKSIEKVKMSESEVLIHGNKKRENIN